MKQIFSAITQSSVTHGLNHSDMNESNKISEITKKILSLSLGLSLYKENGKTILHV